MKYNTQTNKLSKLFNKHQQIKNVLQEQLKSSKNPKLQDHLVKGLQILYDTGWQITPVTLKEKYLYLKALASNATSNRTVGASVKIIKDLDISELWIPFIRVGMFIQRQDSRIEICPSILSDPDYPTGVVPTRYFGYTQAPIWIDLNFTDELNGQESSLKRYRLIDEIYFRILTESYSSGEEVKFKFRLVIVLFNPTYFHQTDHYRTLKK